MLGYIVFRRGLTTFIKETVYPQITSHLWCYLYIYTVLVWVSKLWIPALQYNGTRCHSACGAQSHKEKHLFKNIYLEITTRLFKIRHRRCCEQFHKPLSFFSSCSTSLANFLVGWVYLAILAYRRYQFWDLCYLICADMKTLSKTLFT